MKLTHQAIFLALMMVTMSLAGCLGGDESTERSAEELLMEIDSDGDGVLNNLDLCPDTSPTNASFVDAKGCYDPETWIDDDGDGVVNSEDNCPQTLANQPVFLNGCSMTELDQDGDGVIDVYDECPGSNPEIPTLPNGCQDLYEGDAITSPVEAQRLKNYEFESPHNPVLIGFNVGDGEGRFAVNHGPFATQAGYQLVIGTVLDKSFKSPTMPDEFMLHFTNTQSIQNIPAYIATLEETEGGYGGLFYNSSSGENYLTHAFQYYIWAVPEKSTLSIYDTPTESVLTSTVPCGKPTTEKFDMNFPGDIMTNVSFYDFSGRVVVVEFGAEWCGPCKLLLEELNDLQSDMRSLGIDESQFQILSFTLEDMERNPITASEAVLRQDGESLNFGMGGTFANGYQMMTAGGGWPTLMLLAPNPENDEGLVIVEVGNREVVELFNSKSKIERLYSGEFADDLCNDENAVIDALTVFYDPDIDGDGVANTEDEFPNDATEWTDFDGDGIGDNADQDDDGDGVEDALDLCPMTAMHAFDDDSTVDPNGCGDIDGDGFNQTTDCNDLVSAYNIDSDGDGWCDQQDAFPNDPTESHDYDMDGVGDNADAFPVNPNEQYDNDSDGIGDNQDRCPNTDANASNVMEDGCQDADMDGVSSREDCDDNNSNVNPDIDERDFGADGIDNNCNSYIDEGVLLPIIENITVSGNTLGLSCAISTQSISGAPVRVSYYWIVNGVFVDDDSTFSSALPSEYISKGDDVICYVSIGDDYFSTAQWDDDDPRRQDLTGNTEYTVPNSAPYLHSASLSAGNDGLVCSLSGESDADGDAIGYTFTWFKNGTEFSTGGNGYLNVELQSGDTWSCVVTPNDGEDDGAPVMSNSYTVP